MAYVLTYRGSRDSERYFYWRQFNSANEAKENMMEDFLYSRGELVALEFRVRIEEKSDSIEMYVPHTNIHSEWTVETMDRFCERMWCELEDIEFDEDDDGRLVLARDWFDFKKGTHREEDIWQWFDKHHSKGVGWLMNGYEN